MSKTVVIANCGGFWGDDPTAAKRQVEGGHIDYLVMDYLAEVTMAILQKQRSRRPEAGFAADFLTQLRDVLPACAERGIRIISNAGGVNPRACAAAVEALAAELGIADKVKVGVVEGDDLFFRLDDSDMAGEPLAHMDTGEPLSTVRDSVLSANVYLGAAPVVKALDMGATVVVSGRVTDTGVTLAPLIHEFGWKDDDWDRLAAGIVAGHIIECGTQCTGGNFTDWRKVPSFENMGYPLVDVSEDGTFAVSKHPGTGGMVTVHTVSEQLVYEMGAPDYIAPDCIARFDSIRLEQDGPDRVRVSGVRGGPAPEKLKVSISFAQGYRAFGRLMVSGPDTLEKARTVSDTFWAAAGGRDLYEDTLTQLVGYDSCHPTLAAGEPGEVLVQVAARDADKGKLSTHFAPQLVPRVLSTVPGITYLADQGRPRVSDVVGYWPALISRGPVDVTVTVDGASEIVSSAAKGGAALVFEPEVALPAAPDTGRTTTVPLGRLCLARSGDKGDTANIGVIARSPAIYSWLRDYLTSEFVKRRFETICHGDVERFEVPNLLALNFLLHGSLGGGGTLSLLLDAQGKTYAQYLLAAEVGVDEALLDFDGTA
ncbi:MAG: acyclic terpene utilization AtuA family protein [Planctomycetota bacterium]|jgi:hypothetical protein